jgi:transcriptional regulator with GAF, ATPase, and Fis domain
MLSPAGLQPISVSPSVGGSDGYALDLYRLAEGRRCLGMLGLVGVAGVGSNLSTRLGEVLSLVASTVDRIVAMEKQQRQLSHLTTYITVSSMLAQSLGLRELIQSALDCCKEIAGGEEASILLLDDEQKNLFFYELEGSSKELLVGFSFPADKGIAGDVIQSLQSEIVNDVQHDPRFYGKIDTESQFRTKNMIVVPLVAGEEKIGVMSVLNKINGGNFNQEEHLSLKLIAEEIAFAIRNARIFEYVVDSYCKQRQGLQSCKGCKRHLRSWTPCVKYRETEVV